jgi:hypothetical protein
VEYYLLEYNDVQSDRPSPTFREERPASFFRGEEYVT